MHRRQKDSQATTAKTTPASILAADTVVVGRLDSEDDLILSGRFEGQVRSARAVHLLAGARVEGDIQATEIIVQGEVNGNLLGRERIEIRSGGNVNGDVCAPNVIVQEGVSLNARVRMLGADQHLKDYLLPVLLHVTGQPAPRVLEELAGAAEEFLQEIGFEMEHRPKPSATMRPIFRSREPMSYAQFCIRMSELESALLEASGDRSSLLAHEIVPPQATRQAQELLQALDLAGAAIVVLGPVVVHLQEGNDGVPVREIRLRPESLPSQSAETSQKPGDLLLELQKIHLEFLGEVSETSQVPESH